MSHVSCFLTPCRISLKLMLHVNFKKTLSRIVIISRDLFIHYMDVPVRSQGPLHRLHHNYVSAECLQARHGHSGLDLNVIILLLQAPVCQLDLFL